MRNLAPGAVRDANRQKAMEALDRLAADKDAEPTNEEICAFFRCAMGEFFSIADWLSLISDSLDEIAQALRGDGK